MTYEDWVKATEQEGRDTNRDFAVALLRTEDDCVLEADVIWLEPGKFPTRFPGPQTAKQKLLKQTWDEKWSIHRCAPQPAPERVSLPVGKFLPGGLPDIQF